MPIFNLNSLSISALEEKQQLFKAQDLQTLEKCALALELVGRLRKEGLDFIFKGGTSLMLLFGGAEGVGGRGRGRTQNIKVYGGGAL